MTICIAAITDNNKILAITDKMVTIGMPVATRYEISENNKAIKLTEKCIALFAGNVVYANEILEITKVKMSVLTTPNPSILDITNLMKSAYFEYWSQQLDNQLFQRYSLTLATFMQNQRNLNEELVKKVNEILANANLGVDILVAGIDTTPHLFYIGNPGTITSLDGIGYALIGSGSQHAQLSLIENEYHSGISQKDGLYALIEAKKRAEYDPGVGQLCDIVIIDGNFNKLPLAKVKAIIKEFHKSARSLRTAKKKSAAKIHRLI